MYKCSVYNYCHHKSEEHIIYNTLYNTLVRMNDLEYRKYLGAIDCENELKQEFVRSGLWVEENFDEQKHYLVAAKAFTLYGIRPLNITITTTLKCNARCSYCYEKGTEPVDMMEGADSMIMDFIRHHKGQEGVNINWFGGEPLLNCGFMDTLSYRLQDEKIPYNSYVVTNGSLIDDEVIEKKLQLWHVDNMQVTLDGTSEVYGKRKNYIKQGEGEFYQILYNIKRVAERKVYVSIRLNIERDNCEDILELLKEIDVIFGKYENVVFYPAFITGSKQPLDEDEKVMYIKEMFRAISNPGKLTVGTKLYSLPRMYACMKKDPYSFSIDVYGNLYSCEHLVGHPENAIGSLEEDLSEADTRGINEKFRPECLECKFIPKCMGGCESNYEDGDSPCMIEKYVIQAYLDML